MSINSELPSAIILNIDLADDNDPVRDLKDNNTNYHVNGRGFNHPETLPRYRTNH